MKTREEIEAMTGAEVDAYLARLVGWGQSGCTLNPSCIWCPSISLDDAMQAAEKVGLDSFMLWHNSGNDWGCELDSMLPMRAPTPALAVCRACIAANEAKEK